MGWKWPLVVIRMYFISFRQLTNTLYLHTHRQTLSLLHNSKAAALNSFWHFFSHISAQVGNFHLKYWHQNWLLLKNNNNCEAQNSAQFPTMHHYRVCIPKLELRFVNLYWNFNESFFAFSRKTKCLTGTSSWSLNVSILSVEVWPTRQVENQSLASRTLPRSDWHFCPWLFRHPTRCSLLLQPLLLTNWLFIFLQLEQRDTMQVLSTKACSQRMIVALRDESAGLKATVWPERMSGCVTTSTLVSRNLVWQNTRDVLHVNSHLSWLHMHVQPDPPHARVEMCQCSCAGRVW